MPELGYLPFEVANLAKNVLVAAANLLPTGSYFIARARLNRAVLPAAQLFTKVVLLCWLKSAVLH